ncbi:hypothetical protein GWC95_10510 [Sediminibacterium roseum]|uniref:Uncharacterized protein n=1 Tax=Sediminibacterium roseum TaxID=1978412 RepID=A0ABW9ZV44_9BACT|nr:hypothetical protein [Sediminibacterium roseum]NCI50355.1 hypothetical protein [Sediminibacterium roseum]
MKNTMLASLALITIVSLSFTGAVKTDQNSPVKKNLVKLHAKKNGKTTDVYAYVGYVGEAPGGGQFIGWVQLSEEICDDIDIEIHYMVGSMQYHTITIPASQTYAEDRWGSCPPAYSSEGVGVNSVSISSSCGTKNILY